MLYTPECGICKRYKKKMAKKWSEDPAFKDITFFQGNGSKLRSLAMHFKSHHKIETDLVSFPSWFLWEGGKDGKCWRAFTMGSEEYLTEAFGEFIKPDHVDTKDHKVYGSKF